MEGMNAPHAQPLPEDPTELDLKILDVLHEADQSAPLLAQTLSQSDEQVRVDDVRLRLVGLASGGLARPSGRASRRAEVDADKPTLAQQADPLWEITEEGRTLVELHLGVALAPYDDCGVGPEEEVDDERDVAGLVVLLVIALLTAVCAAYSLLTAAGVLGG
jgi:hypothetical protein